MVNIYLWKQPKEDGKTQIYKQNIKMYFLFMYLCFSQIFQKKLLLKRISVWEKTLFMRKITWKKFFKNKIEELKWDKI